jgi:acyl carrier protein
VDDQVWQRLAAVAAEALGLDPAEISPSSTWDELGADSLERVELSLMIEDAFDVRLPEDAEPEEMATPGLVAGLVEKALADRD